MSGHRLPDWRLDCKVEVEKSYAENSLVVALPHTLITDVGMRAQRLTLTPSLNLTQVTGPVALMEATEAYARYAGDKVTVLAPGLVFAYNWHQAYLNVNPHPVEHRRLCHCFVSLPRTHAGSCIPLSLVLVVSV